MAERNVNSHLRATEVARHLVTLFEDALEYGWDPEELEATFEDNFDRATSLVTHLLREGRATFTNADALHAPPIGGSDIVLHETLFFLHAIWAIEFKYDEHQGREFQIDLRRKAIDPYT